MKLFHIVNIIATSPQIISHLKHLLLHILIKMLYIVIQGKKLLCEALGNIIIQYIFKHI